MAESKISEPLPYWLANVPKSQWPAECPDFLRDISERDKAMISIPDSEFHRLTWPEVQELVKTNQIDTFQRSPFDHRRYKEFVYCLNKQYGSVTDFVPGERLKWNDIEPSKAAPFQDPNDIKILYNDWPYGIDKSIVHLVVWTKFVLEDDPETDDLMPKMRNDIDEYIARTFGSRVPPDKIIWFKNWDSIKSIHGLEHFHVMLKDPDKDFLREITNGDVAVSNRRSKDASLFYLKHELMALDSSGYANRSNGITCFAEIVLDVFSTKYRRLDIPRILDIIQYSGFLYRTHDSEF